MAAGLGHSRVQVQTKEARSLPANTVGTNLIQNKKPRIAAGLVLLQHSM